MRRVDRRILREALGQTLSDALQHIALNGVLLRRWKHLVQKTEGGVQQAAGGCRDLLVVLGGLGHDVDDQLLQLTGSQEGQREMFLARHMLMDSCQVRAVARCLTELIVTANARPSGLPETRIVPS